MCRVVTSLVVDAEALSKLLMRSWALCIGLSTGICRSVLHLGMLKTIELYEVVVILDLHCSRYLLWKQVWALLGGRVTVRCMLLLSATCLKWLVDLSCKVRLCLVWTLVHRRLINRSCGVLYLRLLWC